MTARERGIEVHAKKKSDPDKSEKVFFNEEMQLNRDISQAAFETFAEEIDVKEFRTCDPLAASGIRAFRYAKKSDELHINDINPEAVKAIKEGVKTNKIEAKVTNKDANVHLSEYKNYYNFIDVDPFGGFTRFLDSAARASNYNSMATFTATDNAATTGTYPKVCRRRYSSKPLKTSYMHEISLRIYLKTIFENYARYDKAFEPKVCFHERHYSKAFGRVTESKRRTNRNLENIGYLSHCKKCGWRKLEREERCENCEAKTQMAGPLWTGRLQDKRFLNKMLENIPDDWEETKKLVKKLKSESEILKPYYDIHNLVSIMSIQSPKKKEIIKQIEERGYPVSETHFSPTGIRTDMPLKHLKEEIRKIGE